MSIQNSFYSDTALASRTFPTTKHIATKAHMALWVKELDSSPAVWTPVNMSDYQLINNSAVLNELLDVSSYDMLEIRVADTPDELGDNPTDISIVAGIAEDVSIIADNIDFIAVTNGEYIVNGLPATALEGDIAVNVVDGGIYEYQSGSWVLVDQSTGEIVVPPPVGIVDGLPTEGTEGELVYNNVDGYYYSFIDGEWLVFNTPPPIDEVTGIEVVDVLPDAIDSTEGQVVFLTTDNQMWKFTGGTWGQVLEPIGAAVEVADGSITTAKFAAGLAPIEILAVLPVVDNYIGRTVLLTTDSLLYRYTAAGFTAAIPTQALTGTITSVQMGAASITTPALAAGAITADTIGANAITAGKIAVGAVTAGTIQAAAIGASEIAANAIIATKIAAGAVTADKVSALAISAVNIQSDAITSDKILANSIIAGKIAVGAVSANQIASDSITSDKIVSGSITSTKIGAYAITAEKMDVNALSAVKIQATDTTPSTSGSAMSALVTSKQTGITSETFNPSSTARAIYGHSNGSAIGVEGYAESGFGMYAWTSSGEAGLFGNNMSSATSTFGVKGTGGYGGVRGSGIFGVMGIGTQDGIFGNGTSNGVRGTGPNIGVAGSADTWDFYAAGSGGNYGPFTGAHDSMITKSISTEVGDIVYIDSIINSEGVSQTIGMSKPTDSQMDKRVFGVVAKRNDSPDAENIAALPNDTNVNNLSHLIINSIGEGMMNLCSDNGDIEAGDYICSSSIKGKGMKQNDDILHSYTVAKALESVDWSNETSTVKMIAVTYHCG